MVERASLGDAGATAGTGEKRGTGKDEIKSARLPSMAEARDAVRSVADTQKDKIASRLSGVADALHETVKHLEQDNAVIGRYADLAAEQVDRLSQTLKDRRLDELVEEAEDFARRQPALFVGAALAAGFVFARVVKSSERGSVRRTVRGLTEEARAGFGKSAETAGDALGRSSQTSGREGGAEATLGGAAGVGSVANASTPLVVSESAPGGLR